MGVDIGVHMVAVREYWSQPLHLPFHGLLAWVPGLHSKTFTAEPSLWPLNVLFLNPNLFIIS